MVDAAPPAAQNWSTLFIWFFAGMILFYSIALVCRPFLYKKKNGKYPNWKASMNVWVIQPCDSCCPPPIPEVPESPAPEVPAQEVPAPEVPAPSEKYTMKTDIEYYLMNGGR